MNRLLWFYYVLQSTYSDLNIECTLYQNIVGKEDGFISLQIQGCCKVGFKCTETIYARPPVKQECSLVCCSMTHSCPYVLWLEGISYFQDAFVWFYQRLNSGNSLPGPSGYCEEISKKHIWFSTTKSPLKKSRLRVSKLYREVQPLNLKYGTVQMLLNRSARFMKLFNLVIENMALFKCSWPAPRGSWQRFNLAIENMERFKYV